MELENGIGDTAAFIELERTMKFWRQSHQAKFGPNNECPFYPESWLHLDMISWGLYHTLSARPSILNTLLRPACPISDSPLAVALVEHGTESPDPRIVRLLLEQGANPDDRCNSFGKDRTVWQAFLEHKCGIAEVNCSETNLFLDEEDRRLQVEIIKELLLHGADPFVLGRGTSSNFIRNKLSTWATPEDMAVLEKFWLQRLSRQERYSQLALRGPFLHHVKQWLPRSVKEKAYKFGQTCPKLWADDLARGSMVECDGWILPDVFDNGISIERENN